VENVNLCKNTYPKAESKNYMKVGELIYLLSFFPKDEEVVMEAGDCFYNGIDDEIVRGNVSKDGHNFNEVGDNLYDYDIGQKFQVLLKAQ
jgi:hypothetical protein